MKNKSKKKKC